jgi:hypothetical protein
LAGPTAEVVEEAEVDVAVVDVVDVVVVVMVEDVDDVVENVPVVVAADVDVVVVVVTTPTAYIALRVELDDSATVLVGDVSPSPHFAKTSLEPLDRLTNVGREIT